MGLFGWLFGKPQRVAVRDMIWLTEAARVRGAAEAIDLLLAAKRPVLVLAQFPAALAAFGEQVIGTGRPHATIPTTLTPAAALELAAGPPRVLLGLVRNLRPTEFPPEDAPESPLPVLVLERHFLRAHDDEVVRFAEGLGGRASVDFYVSLEDPLMSLFAGEWVKNVLRQLGMQEDERLESGMVARRIRAAQGQVAKSIPTDHDANSAVQWLERNRAAG